MVLKSNLPNSRFGLGSLVWDPAVLDLSKSYFQNEIQSQNESNPKFQTKTWIWIWQNPNFKIRFGFESGRPL